MNYKMCISKGDITPGSVPISVFPESYIKRTELNTWEIPVHMEGCLK